jgi:protein-tyrosine-phosphatase/DNA-binding HxlR family transcriptional regulator
MPLEHPPELLKLLAHDLRWTMVRSLARGDQRVHELAALTGEPMNLVSYHLKQMRQDGLVISRRSQADGRDVYYALDLDQVNERLAQAGRALHPALAAPAVTPPVPAHPLRVLVLCTHNSARSQMAEGWLRHLGGEHLTVASAGSHPTRVDPLAIQAMAALGVDISAQQSKHWSAVEGTAFDTLITVCDQARENCPTFPGMAESLHWGFPDPTLIPDRAAREQAFHETAARLRARVQYFLSGL